MICRSMTTCRQKSAAQTDCKGLGLRLAGYPLRFLILTAFLTVVAVAHAQCFSVPSGLIGWWPSEGNANNMLGTNNGALVGGATASAAGFVGSTFTFDGTNGYVQVADSPILRPTNITIEAWVRFAGLDTPGTASAGDQYIVFKQNTRSGGFEGYNLSKTRIVGGDVFAFLATSAAGQLVEIHSTTFVTTNVWYHCAAVRGSNFVQMYVNGQLQSQAAIAFPLDYGNFPLYFGTSGQSYWDRKMKGTLDEVSLYSRALSSNEISALYTASVSGKCKLANITNQPLSQAVMIGGNANFTVGAGGFGALGYQWRFSGTNIGGATATTYTRLNAQPADAGNYSVVVTNPGGAVTSAVATLVVNIPPSISTPPQSLTVNQGQNAGFSVTAGGTGSLSYQWRFSGTNINGATASNYTRVSAQLADIGNYVVIVTNVAGAVTSSIATLSVNIPPSILAPPQNATVTQGQDATFNVTAGGTAPLGYQWRFNGGNIGGAIGSSYTRVSAQPTDAGSYSVVVSNMAGTVTSVVASLTVNVPPGISVPPQNLTVIQNQNAAFSVTATGTAPLSYQWRFNGTNISGAVSSSYTRLNAQPADAGNYAVVVSNVAGAITSAVATLTVNVPPSISTPPQSLTVNQSQNALFSITAAGTAPLSYQWRFNGSDILGATASDYTRFNAQGSDAGGYSVVINNMAGSVTSAVASLNVSIPPGISVPPQNLTVNQGQNADFNVTATGTGPLSYQWRFNGADITGATASDYTRTSAQSTDVGNYEVVVANVAGSITSAVATLNVNLPPGISLPPQNLTVNQGQNAGFSVTATGTGPLSFQWRFNGADISGATATDFTRMNAQASDAGAYTVVVTNVAGAITSSEATLNVNIPPGISVPPQSVAVNQSQPAGFSVTATGTMPLTYQWRLNGNNIIGATDSDYFRFSVQPPDVGNYTVVVGNMAGAITSAVATLSLNVPPSISEPPQTLTVNQGENASFSVIATGTAPLSYQWCFNGASISSATASDYTRFNAQPADAGAYTVVVTNVAGAITSSVAVLTVGYPPGISIPPQSLTVNQGQNAGFSVTATGSLPLNYQWRFNGTNISGATASDYTRLSAQAADAGSYAVVITNIAGAITSAVASLTVNVPPSISVPPQNLTVNQGQNAFFSVGTTGTAPFSYQWRFNGTNIAGATLSEYARISAQLTDGGGYSAVVGNVAGSVTSIVAILTVNGPPTITAQPGDLTVIQNQDANFSVVATGTAPLYYRWRFAGTDIGGATSSAYLRTNAQAADAGGYSVVISNVAGVVTSAVASLTVNIPPGILIPPQGQTVFQNQDATFFVVANGTTPRSYQWRFSGTNIAGATDSSYTRSGAQPVHAGAYRVVVTNVAGSITSAVANLTINSVPGILTQPQNLTNVVGTTATFTVAASGLQLSYQWRFNGINIGYGTDASLSVTNVQSTNAGNYIVVVTNPGGSVTSAVGVLTVLVPPSISGQPQSRTNTAGTLATFTVTAGGTALLKYQWRLNGASLNGATESTLSLSGVQPGDGGDYSVVITNGAGSITSAVATLTVIGSFKTWYVDSTAIGSANRGTNWANAWTNLNSIFWGGGGVQAGDTLYISGGNSAKIYTNEWIVGASGTASHPIRIAIDGTNTSHNGRVIFDYNYGGDVGDLTAITCLRDYVTLDGNVNGESRFVISNLRNYTNKFTGVGVYAEDSIGITVDHMVFTNCNNPVRLTTSTGFRVCNSQFYKVRGDGAILAAACFGGWDANLVYSNSFELAYNEATPPGANSPYYGPDGVQCGSGISIFGNTFRETRVTNIYTSDQHPDFIQAVGNYTKVYGNEFINIGDSAVDYGLYSDAVAEGVWIYNNIFRIEETIDSFPEFIRFYNGSLALMDNIKILNNTFVDNNNWINIRIENFGTPVSFNNEIKNNIFVNCGSTQYKPVIYFDNGCSFDSESWKFDGNVYYHSQNLAYVYYGNSYPVSAWVSKFEPKGKTNAPAFVNYVPFGKNNDFHLLPSDFVALDAGVDVSASINTAKDGTARPQGAGWDIGAFELPGGGYAYTNLPPTISSISQNVADADASAPGVQVLRNTSVQYSALASDPNGTVISWQWIYQINGGQEVPHQSGAGPVTPANFTYGSATAGNTYTWILRVSDGFKSAQSVLKVDVITAPRGGSGNLIMEAESGTVTAPFVISDGYVTQLVKTNASNSGRAAYSFNVTQPGQYVLQAVVDAPAFGANSFLVDIDQEPNESLALCKLPVTLGFENHIVSWQGEGTCAAPQWNPKVFTLAGGAHQLIIRGKDANVSWDQFSMVLLPDVVTLSATNISFNHATLLGAVNPQGNATTVRFQYGLTTSYGSFTPAGNAGAGTSLVPVSLVASGLDPQKTYHFRIVASTAAGTIYGQDQVFTTLPAPTYNGSQFTFWTTTEVGHTYYLEYILAIGNTNWTVAASVVGDGLLHALVDPQAAPPQRFYRIRSQ